MSSTSTRRDTPTGSGNAFQLDCDAAANMGVTGLPPIDGLHRIDPEFCALLDLSEAVDAELTFKGDEYLEVLRLFQRDADPVISATIGKVLESAPGAPRFGKGIYYQTTNGKPINAFDGGMAGWGVKVRNENGRVRTIGQQWNDTNNHDAAQHLAVHHTKQLLMLALAQLESPEQCAIIRVTDLHLSDLPAKLAFDAEMARKASIRKEVFEKLEYIRMAASLAATDTDSHGQATDNVYTAQSRNEFAKDFDDATRNAYLDKLDNTPSFSPPSLGAVEEQFMYCTGPQLCDALERQFALLQRQH